LDCSIKDPDKITMPCFKTRNLQSQYDVDEQELMSQKSLPLPTAAITTKGTTTTTTMKTTLGLNVPF
jgi:hypothetical protein